mgnify:CR=1 FL=1
MINSRIFGSVGEKEIRAIELSNEKGMRAVVLTLGAALQSITVPDKNGKEVDVCLGYDTPQEYLANTGYFGACIGRHANRIGGAAFTLNGVKYTLDANEGRNQLHGGANGFDRKIWDCDITPDAAEFRCTAEHLEGGFPGRIETRVRYSLDDDNGLTIEYTASCDEDTVVNLTNHCYFNLSGHDSGDVLDHVITIHAGAYTPADEESIPTGEILSVEGTPLDFRSGRVLRDGIDSPEFAPFAGYDHNFVTDGSGFREVACAFSPVTGIGMRVITTLEGMQLYTGNHITPRAGKRGAGYAERGGFCMETQHFPDAVNKPAFPSPILKKGEIFSEKTCYRFFR